MTINELFEVMETPVWAHCVYIHDTNSGDVLIFISDSDFEEFNSSVHGKAVIDRVFLRTNSKPGCDYPYLSIDAHMEFPKEGETRDVADIMIDMQDLICEFFENVDSRGVGALL